jgi:hypothetical protein
MQIVIEQARDGQFINDEGDFDCEILHPQHGWIPYTAHSGDADQTIDNEALRALLGENIAPFDPVVDAVALLEGWRMTAALDRAEFCIALLTAGILSPASATAAAQGQWPAEFDGAIASLPEAHAAIARIRWASAASVSRVDPLLESLRQFNEMSHETLDVLFGWQS